MLFKGRFAAPLVFIFLALQLAGFQLSYAQDSFRSATHELCNAYSGTTGDSGFAYAQALACLALKRPAEAERIFQNVLSQMGESPSLRILLGIAFKITEHWQEAVREFERAIKLDPTGPKAHYYLGLTLLLSRGAPAFEPAMKQFQLELELNPDQYLPNFYMGLVLTLGRDDDEALRYLLKAIEIDPSNPDPYLYTGQVLVRSEKTHEAIEALRESIALTKDPGRNSYQVSNAEYILGQILLKSGSRKEAVQHIKKSQELKRLQYQAAQVDFQARTLTGVSAAPSGMASHDFRDLRDVEPGLNLNRPSPDDQTQAGHKSAEHLYRNTAAKALQTVAGIASEQQDLTSAVGYLETAVRLAPEKPELFYQLSQAYARAGHPKQAEKALEKYKELVK